MSFNAEAMWHQSRDGNSSLPWFLLTLVTLPFISDRAAAARPVRDLAGVRQDHLLQGRLRLVHASPVHRRRRLQTRHPKLHAGSLKISSSNLSTYFPSFRSFMCVFKLVFDPSSQVLASILWTSLRMFVFLKSLVVGWHWCSQIQSTHACLHLKIQSTLTFKHKQIELDYTSGYNLIRKILLF